MLVGYGVVAAYLFGLLMNLWYWPFAVGAGTEVSFVPGGGVWENLHRFLIYTLTTSTLGWDTGRAITNALAILAFGPAMLATLRRASRRASFGAPVTFDSPASPPSGGRLSGAPPKLPPSHSDLGGSGDV